MFGTKRLGDILASFQKTIDDLKALEDANQETVEENRVAVEKLTNESLELSAEASKSAIVRGKVEALISA